MIDIEKSFELMNTIIDAVGKRYGDVYGKYAVIDCPLCGGKDTMTVKKDQKSYDLEAYCTECDDGIEFRQRKPG